MTQPTLATTWAIPDESKDALHVRVEEKPLSSGLQNVAGELSLDTLPWLLTRVARDGISEAVPCEVLLDFGEAPLQCNVLQLQLASSARHIELHVDGVRRNMLGEEERNDLYLGTFRGAKGEDNDQGQVFTVSEEFRQTNRDHDVLRCIHKIRIKFVSLTGDKNALVLSAFRCLYIAPAQQPGANPASNAANSTTGSAPSVADVMNMMSNASLGSGGHLNPQMILATVQQMMEREIEAKISRALDAKLAVLSQRLSFSEQMLLQVQQRSTARDAQVEKKLDILQQQLADLRSQVNPKEPPPEEK